MKIEIKEYSSFTTLISSLLFFILGAVIFTNSDSIMTVITYVMGGLVTLLGFISCFKNYLDVRRNPKASSLPMVIGILLMVIGLVCIFLAPVVNFLVRLITGGWLLFAGINRLANALFMERKDSLFFALLTLAILLIVGGIYTILKANLPFKYLGIVLMVYATLEIIGYIINIINRKGTTKVVIEEAEVVSNQAQKEDVKEIEINTSNDNGKKKNKKNKKGE